MIARLRHRDAKFFFRTGWSAHSNLEAVFAKGPMYPERQATSWLNVRFRRWRHAGVEGAADFWES